MEEPIWITGPSRPVEPPELQCNGFHYFRHTVTLRLLGEKINDGTNDESTDGWRKYFNIERYLLKKIILKIIL
ncbi:hypothetical protein B1H10_02300 [candidate division KSB1 bacterium 4484_188]|nr:MAG: hypothetical protein B1H10_02300 [candidate division KSB1 bacterium 4484_188]